MTNRRFRRVAENTDAGVRLDVFLSHRLPELTRSQIVAMIRSGRVSVDGGSRKPAFRLNGGETITGELPEPLVSPFLAEPMDLDIRYEDSHIIVVNKPAGLVVHPAPGHTGGTLVNGLLHHCPDLGMIGADIRPGIVHRLDKDTTGTLVAAKNAPAMAHLARQFKHRTVSKTYYALVWGHMPAVQGHVQLPIGRHRTARKKMSVNSRQGRSADTHWRVKEVLDRATLLEIDLRTGRTHQIRVHCAAIGRPVIGDPVYGGRPWRTDPRCGHVRRQMLHAWRLTFVHPHTDELLTIESPMPQDMLELIEAFRP